MGLWTLLLHAIERSVHQREASKKKKESFTYLGGVAQKEAQGYQQAADHHKCNAHDGADFGHNYILSWKKPCHLGCVINGAKEMMGCV